MPIAKGPQGLQQRSYDCGNNVGGYDCDHLFGPGVFCCDFGNGTKRCATKEGCPTEWSQKHSEVTGMLLFYMTVVAK